jgi:hypothetical protein
VFVPKDLLTPMSYVQDYIRFGEIEEMCDRGPSLKFLPQAGRGLDIIFWSLVDLKTCMDEVVTVKSFRFQTQLTLFRCL